MPQYSEPYHIPRLTFRISCFSPTNYTDQSFFHFHVSIFNVAELYNFLLRGIYNSQMNVIRCRLLILNVITHLGCGLRLNRRWGECCFQNSSHASFLYSRRPLRRHLQQILIQSTVDFYKRFLGMSAPTLDYIEHMLDSFLVLNTSNCQKHHILLSLDVNFSLLHHFDCTHGSRARLFSKFGDSDHIQQLLTRVHKRHISVVRSGANLFFRVCFPIPKFPFFYVQFSRPVQKLISPVGWSEQDISVILINHSPIYKISS